MTIKVIKFSAKWCGPCRKIAADYAALVSQAVYSNIEFMSADVDDDPELSEQYKIKGLPAVILLVDGVEVGRHVGANITSIRALLDSAFH